MARCRVVQRALRPRFDQLLGPVPHDATPGGRRGVRSDSATPCTSGGTSTEASSSGTRTSTPLPADAMWLAFYVLLYVAIVELSSSRTTRFQPSTWLDGGVGGLGAAALIVAFALGPALEVTDGSLAVVATNLAYPDRGGVARRPTGHDRVGAPGPRCRVLAVGGGPRGDHGGRRRVPVPGGFRHLC